MLTSCLVLCYIISMSAVRDEVVANVTKLEQRINELQHGMMSNHGDSNHSNSGMY